MAQKIVLNFRRILYEGPVIGPPHFPSSGSPDLALVKAREKEGSNNSCHLTSYDVWFRMAGHEGNLPLWVINDNGRQASQLTWTELYVDCAFFPFDFETYGYNFSDNQYGRFVRLHCALIALSEAHERDASVQDFLDKVETVFRLNPEAPDFREPSQEIRLISSLTEDGFFVDQAYCHSRVLTLRVSWRAQKQGLGYPTAWMDFRPRSDRTLGPGKCIRSGDWAIGRLLWPRWEKLAPSKAIDCLPDDAHGIALSHFKWTRLSLMTHKEARAARVSFVRKHHALHDDQKAMAYALKAEGLYSEETGIYQICKFLPGLIREATNTDDR